jgi:hypothetical protein
MPSPTLAKLKIHLPLQALKEKYLLSYYITIVILSSMFQDAIHPENPTVSYLPYFSFMPSHLVPSSCADSWHHFV